MATVYLALQESVQREIALKIMSPTLLGDNQFSERFLREAQIAAKLRHPHVVQIHDVSNIGDHYYIAMEYLPGGPVLARNSGPRTIAFALRVTREIASALGYAHTKGVIHRDIKPDNILLREDGAAVLTDFGIARASDNSRMTRTGTIIGTPHYMSPEQARGLPLDGRADLYSLGIVFHELLLGQVPYQAEDPLAVGIMHITAPLPRLPGALTRLQATLDRMLAKDPEQRFQSGAELAAAVEQLERERTIPPRPASSLYSPRATSATASPSPPSRPVSRSAATSVVAPVTPSSGASAPGELSPLAPPPTLSVGAPTSKSTPAVSPAKSAPVLASSNRRMAGRTDPPAAPDADALLRAEPTLGHIDEALHASPPPRRIRETPPQPRRKARLWLLALLILIGGGGAAAWHFQHALRELWPQTRMADLLQRAEQALREDRLSGSDGSGARELYSVALALDPDNLSAREGLQRVGMRLLERVRTALDANEFDLARAALAEARELSVPAADADALQRELDQRAARGVGLEALLGAARQALQAGQIDEGEESAIVLYRRVLEADAGNALAVAGLRDALAALLERARMQIEAAQFDDAARQIEAVAAIDPAHLGLPDARARLASARAQRQTDLDSQLQIADSLLAAGKLLTPKNNNAHDTYLAVLQRDPANARAREGIARIAASLIAQAQRRMADFEFERAAELLDQAAAVAPAASGLSAARQRLHDLEQRSEQTAPPDPGTTESQARIAQLLQEARAAAAAGNLLAPPGDSAYDKYRAVSAIDPHNQDARSGLAALPALARQRFDDALGANRLATARGAIEALTTLSPSDAALPEMRRRLARSLLGQADERLGAGELKRATEAFDQARELDPTHPDLPAMQARLEQARGG